MVELLEEKRSTLACSVDVELEHYFSIMEDDLPVDLHKLFMGEVEGALLRNIMHRANGNQSLAAEMLGINRGTLRKKLHNYGIVE